MELEELFTALMAHSDRKAVVKGLHEHAQPIYQLIFNRGHTAATSKGEEKATSLEEKITKLEADLAAAEKRAKEAESKTPDAAAIRAELTQQLEAERAKHRDDLKALREAHKGTLQEREISNLQRLLVEAGVEKRYAKVLAADPDVRKRLKIEDNGTLTVLQAGKDAIPVAVDEGKDPMSVLVAELKAETPAEFVTTGIDPNGSGERRTPGSGANAGDSAYFDGLRKSAEEARKAAAPAAGADPLAQRMGM